MQRVRYRLIPDVWLTQRSTHRDGGNATHIATIRSPTAMDTKLRQRVRYLRAEDGVQLAWAEIGAAPVLIKAAYWMIPSRVRSGKPGLGALDPLSGRPSAGAEIGLGAGGQYLRTTAPSSDS
jgi:hypothetical protein